ncbi:MAG: hypothetical protein BWY31_02870 [Lentisphaerae bacterium ADurb.Bin242]|nr:MAG: hypothetical protein BWY31_02870 [Lentisphaerae bacterium ADurb.Bin242]
MSALTSNRNTTEILCHAQKFHRIKTVKDNTTLYVGSIAAIAASTGKAEPAADSANLVVLGRVEGFTADGKAIIKTGVFKFDNGADSEALSIADVNKTVYALDDHTVGKSGGTNKIKAGILRDIDRDGQVIVELGTLHLG